MRELNNRANKHKADLDYELKHQEEPYFDNDKGTVSYRGMEFDVYDIYDEEWARFESEHPEAKGFEYSPVGQGKKHNPKIDAAFERYLDLNEKNILDEIVDVLNSEEE